MAGLNIPNGFSVPQMKYPIISQLGLLNDSNYSDYITSYPSLVRDSYIMKTEAAGGTKYTPTKKWKQWIDNNKPLPSFKVTGAGAGAAGAAVTVTLTTGSHMGSGTLSPVAVGQIYEDDLNGIQYEVRAVVKTTPSAHTVSLAPTKASQSAAITTASLLKYQGRNSVIEASSQQDGIYSGVDKRERDLQIIRTNKSYSDLAKFEILEYKGESYYTIDRTNLEKEHIMTKELTLMFGDKKDNLTAAAGNQNTDAQGLIPTILQYGTDLTATTTLSDAFFQDLKRANDADGYTTKYDVLCDTEFWLAYQAYLRAAGTASNIVVNVNLNDRDKTIQGIFDFSDEVKMWGMDLTLKNYAYFNSSRTHGADINTGFWRGSAVFLPIGSKYNEAAEGELPYFRVRYMSDSADGVMNHFDTDGALVGKNTKREVELALTSYNALEMYNVKAFKYAKIRL